MKSCKMNQVIWLYNFLISLFVCNIISIPKRECKVIIEKSRGGRFFMEQELRFGLDLGQLGLLKKKIGPIVSNF